MQKNILKLITILCMLVVLSPSTIFAAPPVGGYEPGETLNPSCAPGEIDCVVTPLIAQDEGVDLSGNVLKLNFEGAGVSSAIASGVVTVTIPGGSGGLTSLNGLTGSTQTFAIGSSGTSPAWSSSGTAHTLNLPTASGTNTGILSSSDWTTFNNKVSSQWTTSAPGIYFNNNVGIGTTNVSNRLTVDGTKSLFLNSANSTSGVYMGNDGTFEGLFDNENDGLIAGSQIGDNRYSYAGGVLKIGVTDPVNSEIDPRAFSMDLSNNGVLMFDQVAADGFTSLRFDDDGNYGIEDSLLVGIRSAAELRIVNGETPDTDYFRLNPGENKFFVGQGAGQNASVNAINSIFIGKNAGQNDTTLDNSSGGPHSSILIGDNTSTGGFSNSIGLGAGATNTSANQFLIDDSYIYLSLRGVNYELPLADGAAGNVLTTDGAGVLSWSAGGGDSSLIGSTDTIDSETWLGQGAGGNGGFAEDTVFIGANAGYGATSANSSVFVGLSAGQNAIDAEESVFVGTNAGDGATDAPNAIFVGISAGQNAVNARYSIFLGNRAGQNDTVDNGGTGKHSILIGDDTSTGGFSNSIGLGTGATNTASNEFMIGSATSPIDSTRINGSASTQCTITTGTGIACTSDERLKDNIEDLQNGTLEKLIGLRAVTYTWAQDENSTEQVGFLAQQLESLFPQLVATDADGYKSVFYSQITPILTKAIQELHAIVTDFIDDFKERVQTEELCLGDTCITETELQQLLELREQNNTPAIPNLEDETQEEAIPDEEIITVSEDVPVENVEVIVTEEVAPEPTVEESVESPESDIQDGV